MFYILEWWPLKKTTCTRATLEFDSREVPGYPKFTLCSLKWVHDVPSEFQGGSYWHQVSWTNKYIHWTGVSDQSFSKKHLMQPAHTQVTYNHPQAELLSESQEGGIRPKIYVTEMHCPYSCFKGHACQKCSANYLLDLDLNMQRYFSSILSYFFSNERSRGLHCYIPLGAVVVGVCFLQENQVLQCKSSNSTVARFSQYPTQSIQRKAADRA